MGGELGREQGGWTSRPGSAESRGNRPRIGRASGSADRSSCADAVRYLSVTQEDIQPPQTSPRERASMPDCKRSCLYDRARQGLRSRATGPRSRVGREWLGHLACLPSQDRSRGGQGEKGHAMTNNDDLPAEVRRQDEEAELKIAAQLAGLGKGTEATHDDDLPAEVRRQDEEAELQIAAQVAGLRTD